MPKTKTLDMDILRLAAMSLIFMLNISHQFAFFSDSFTFLRLFPHPRHTVLCKCLSGIRLDFKDFFFFCSNVVLFSFSRMGNFTSSSTVGSSTTCLQYVQVSKCLQIGFLQSAYERFRHSLFDEFCIQADEFTSQQSFLVFLASVHLNYLDDVHLIPSCLFEVLYIFKGKGLLPTVKNCTKSFGLRRKSIYSYTQTPTATAHLLSNRMYLILFTRPLTEGLSAAYSCILLISNETLLFPKLSGSCVPELCGDIFQDHLSLLQNGQECVQ